MAMQFLETEAVGLTARERLLHLFAFGRSRYYKRDIRYSKEALWGEKPAKHMLKEVAK